MKKTLATIGVVTATAFAGLGVATVASAQVDDGSTGSTDSGADVTEDGRSGERGERDGNRRGKGCGDKLEGVAETLGMDADQLKAELEAGATLAEIAEANGVDPDVLVDQMVADATERIESKVADGRITDEEAAEKLASKTERIEDRVFGDDAESADAPADGEGS